MGRTFDLQGRRQPCAGTEETLAGVGCAGGVLTEPGWKRRLRAPRPPVTLCPVRVPSHAERGGEEGRSREEGVNRSGESSEPAPNRHQHDHIRQLHWSAAAAQPPPCCLHPPPWPQPLYKVPPLPPALTGAGDKCQGWPGRVQRCHTWPQQWLHLCLWLMSPPCPCHGGCHLCTQQVPRPVPPSQGPGCPWALLSTVSLTS